MDEVTIERWEKILEIFPYDDDTLNDTIENVILEFITLNLKHMVAIYTKNIFNAIQDTLADIKIYEQANPNDNNYITEEEITNLYKNIDRYFFHRVIIL